MKVPITKAVRLLKIIFILFFAFDAIAQSNVEHVLLHPINDQIEEKENWRDINFTLLDSINLDEHEIYYPHALTINKENQLAAMAWDDRSVYVFNLSDIHNPVKIPTRMGRGPGEYEYPFDMFLSNEKLLISDIGLRKIDIWNIQSQKLIQSFRLDNAFIKPDQIAFCKTSDGKEILNVL